MMFIRRGITKRCVRAPRPKRRAGETLIITTAIQIGWVKWPGAPEAPAGVEWEGGKVTFCGWINTVLRRAAVPSSGYRCGYAWNLPRVCECVCVYVSGLDLAVALTPLWVNRKKERLMKNAEYITLEEKFFSPPLTYSFMGMCILGVFCLIKIKYVCIYVCVCDHSWAGGTALWREQS